MPAKKTTKSYCSDLYDPDHPDADWSGFVPKRSNKKHVRTLPLQLTVIDGNGIGPCENAQIEEWKKPARKSVSHKESYAGFCEGGDDEGLCYKSSTFSLIGGPVPVNDPSSVKASRWETEAQAAAKRKSTNLGQFTDNGRSMQVRGLKRMQEVAENETKASQGSNNLNNTVKSSILCEKLFSSNSHTSSFLANLGKELAKENLGATKYVSTAPFATDGNVPTDPYRTANGERRKDLLLENYSCVVPGYTGKRTLYRK
eukprot:CAMPEP_0184867664 /NCGR_PEP_ID=MMETSP0580-20130426/27457_1 /TAXON_ID=1118495 /ORGANISM="Dactyliosolen fragilissimus" /LENGTH=256 /DNA_ID=CAMNT_0027368087 /DNA_START=82 /DNA_END=852 /DNA_ORIENTATION=+